MASPMETPPLLLYGRNKTKGQFKRVTVWHSDETIPKMLVKLLGFTIMVAFAFQWRLLGRHCQFKSLSNDLIYF